MTAMTAAEVARVGCIICRHHLALGYVPAEVHHCRILGGKRQLAYMIPLCPQHHRIDVHSLHRAKRIFRDKYGDEETLYHLADRYLSEIKRNTI